MWRVREGDAGDLRAGGQRGSLSADVRERQPQRRRAHSRAGETYAYSEALKSYPFAHYADAVWDTTRMNNILDHFATAYFGLWLKGEQDKKAYLTPAPNAPWKGFKPRTGVGLTLEHAEPAAPPR
jgi:hypothetical protein